VTRPLARAVAAICGAALLAACSGPSARTAPAAAPTTMVTVAAPNGPTGTTPTSPATATAVRATTCSTVYAITPGPPAPRQFPATVAPGTSWYVDSAMTMAPLLAPTGWGCKISVGADGSSAWAIYPPGQPPPPAGSPAGASQAVELGDVPACQGCAVQLACALVPQAAAQMTSFGGPCKPRTAAERVTWLAGSPRGTSGPFHDVVAFEDPPGVAGTGQPSGGPYPANGVLIYDYTPATGSTAALETCTLPEADHARCTVVLNDFVARHG
jgi:hypothetical protein